MNTENIDEVLQCTPPEIRALATATTSTLLPGKSREIYEKNYAQFENWRKENKITTISENVLLAYFELKRQKYKSSTLWSLYSQLKSCLSIYMNVDITKYYKLQTLLKRCSEGYIPKKSKILEEHDINKFIAEADNKLYMAKKVILIVGYSGACRREELTNMSTDDIEFNEDSIKVSIPKTKNYLPREFVITEKVWINLVKNYAALRPKNATHKRFFVTYRNGLCTNSPIGINTMGKVPKEIATFLRLPDPELYTGHCFRRSSATQLANRGGDLLTLKRHGGWKSSTVAEGYVEATLKKKIEVAEMLRPQNVDLNLPSCSRVESHTHSNLESSGPNSDTTTGSVDNNNIQHNIITNENIPGVVIHSKDNSNVTVNVYNNCSFYSRN